MHTMTGAELAVRLLERQGISVVAGVPGGANLPLYDALHQRNQIRHVLARHEQGAAFMAQGMARATGRPQVCLATSGPGATNLATGIADAKADSIPLVCLTGQVPQAFIGTDAFQEVDTYGMTVPLTKHNYLARSAAALLEIIPQAFSLAASGRPGPVVIDLPKDVQQESVSFAQWPEPGGVLAAPRPGAGALRDAARLLQGAARPVILCGGGVVAAGAGAALRELAERQDVPVVPTLMGLDAVPTDHPLCLGMLGMHGARCTNLVVAEADLLLAVGMRFDDRATGKVSAFCPAARVIHIDIDESEIDKVKAATVSLVGDAGEVLGALGAEMPARERSVWRERVRALQDRYPLAEPGRDEVLSPYGLVHAVAEALPEDGIITTDVGQHQMWVAQAYPFRRARTWQTSGGLGTMGFGLPAAIGASLACPGRAVVCFSGDGSLLMNIQELATAAEEGAAVKVVLMNNQSLGLVRQQQTLFYGARRHASEYRHAVDFVAVARGFGVPAVDLGGAPDPRAALSAALTAPGPCLIHAPIGAEEQVFPMVPPGAANEEMLEGECHVCV